MRIAISFLPLLLFAQFGFGQTDSLTDNTFCIKVSPLSLIDPYGGNSYRLGAEFKIFGNYAFSAEGGGYIANGLTGFTNAHGFIVKPELKLYLNKQHKTEGKFVSIEYQYKNILFDYSDSISIPQTPTYDKKYTIQKNINCMTLKYGELFTCGAKNRLVMEWHAGLGIRMVNGRSDLTPEEEAGIYRPGDNSVIYALITQLGNYTLPNIDLGIKIGYRFK